MEILQGNRQLYQKPGQTAATGLEVYLDPRLRAHGREYSFGTDQPEGMLPFLRELQGRTAFPTLAQGKRVYEGGWYRQAGPQCTIHAFAHAALAAGAMVDSFQLLELARFSEYSNKNVSTGLSVDDLARYYTDRAYGRLMLRYDMLYDDLKVNPNTPQQAISTCMRWLSDAEKKRGLLLYLSPRTWYGDTSIPKNEGHTVAVVGYSVNKEQEVDFQVIDSNFGVGWAPAELMFESIESRFITIVEQAERVTASPALPLTRRGEIDTAHYKDIIREKLQVPNYGQTRGLASIAAGVCTFFNK